LWHQIRNNKNVALNFVGTISGGCSYGILGYSVMAAYIFLLTDNSNSLLGYSEGAQGLAQLVPGLLAGYLADKFRRDRVIRVAGFISGISIFATLFVVLADGRSGDVLPIPGLAPWMSNNVRGFGEHCPWRFILLTVALSLWSAAMGVSNAPMQAIFADSLPTGRRTEIYTTLTVAATLSYGIGPLIAMVAFCVIGDSWTIETLTLIILIGVVVYIPALVTFFLYDDSLTLGEASEAVHTVAAKRAQRDEATKPDPLDASVARSQPGAALCAPGGAEDVTREGDAAAQPKEEGGEGLHFEELRAVGCIEPSWIPGILWASDLIWSFGSGMTVKFFPIFFLNRSDGLGLSPTMVNLIFVLNPLLIAIGTQPQVRLV